MLSRKWMCKPKQWESWSLSRNQRCVFLSWFLDRCKEAAHNKDDKTDVFHTINIWSVAAPVFQAEGYTDGDLTLFHSFPITAFLKAENPVDFLAKASEVRSLGYGTAKLPNLTNISDLFCLIQIIFDNKDLESHAATTNEIKECCRDIRVLGRKELR